MLMAGLCAAMLSAAPLSSTDAKAFRGDVDFVVQNIMSKHPAPFAHADRARFFKDEAAVKAQGPKRGLGCAVAELTALIAELNDGHTYVLPINIPGMERWYPVRFYAFPDGLYVTSIAPEYAALAGKKVAKIGSLDAETAMAKAVALQAANNPLAAREGMVWLSNAAIAEAIGAAAKGGLTVTTEDGTTQTLKPFDAEINDAWNQQGEMFGPRRRKDAQPYVTAFGSRGPLDFRKYDPALPPHLRYRSPYHMVEIPEHRALYFQWNFVQDWGDEPFTQFSERLFKALDAHPDWRLIVDVRYNSGGDGSKVPPFIKQIIKRKRFDAPGNFFVITGRKTFSAAVDFVAEAKAWTSAIFVGEPTGAGLNAYGDAEEHVTPGLHIPFQTSTNFHGHGDTHDTEGSIDPDIPALMTGPDYFASRDPVLDTILNGGDAELLPLPLLGVKDGPDAAVKALADRKAKWSGFAWWIPFKEREMNSAAYDLLRANRAKDAVILFQLNTAAYPKSSNTWDSLAEAERAAGDVEGAKRDYAAALKIDPDLSDAKDALADIAKTGK